MFERNNQKPICQDVKIQKWSKWIGHILCKPAGNITRKGENPQGERRVGRLKQTWRRSGKIKAKTKGLTWAQLKKIILHQGTYRDGHSKHKPLAKGRGFLAVVSNKKKQRAFQAHAVITCCEFWSLRPRLTE